MKFQGNIELDAKLLRKEESYTKAIFLPEIRITSRNGGLETFGKFPY